LAPGRVNAYAFPGAVIISDEYGGLAFPPCVRDVVRCSIYL
jgi:hypothetical protein